MTAIFDPAVDAFPIELLAEVFQYYPKGMYMVNKELTDLYFKKNFEEMNVDYPDKRVAKMLKSKLFPYASYFTGVYVDLMKMSKEHQEFDFSLFDLKRINNLEIDCEEDPYNQFENIVKKFLYVTELAVPRLDTGIVFNAHNHFKNVTILSISNPSPQMICLNRLPKLKELRIAQGFKLGPFSPYSRISPLIYIENLSLDDHYHADIQFLPRCFPNLKTLHIAGDMDRMHYDFSNMLKLQELTCQGPFTIPKTVKKVKCMTMPKYDELTIPDKKQKFESVAFYFHSYTESSEDNFHKAINYCRSVPHECTVAFMNKLVFSNRKVSPFNFYSYTFLQDLHVYTRSFASTLMVDDIMHLKYLHDFMDGYLFKTDWNNKELRNKMERDTMKKLSPPEREILKKISTIMDGPDEDLKEMVNMLLVNKRTAELMRLLENLVIADNHVEALSGDDDAIDDFGNYDELD